MDGLLVQYIVFGVAAATLPAFFYFGVVFLFKRTVRDRFLYGGVTIIFLLAAWSFWAERYIIQVREHTIDIGADAKIVLIADFHAGIWKGEQYVARVTKILNSLDADAVVIAGDFSNDPSGDWDRIFQSFQDVRIPVYGVLGNHDTAHGASLEWAVTDALSKNSIVHLENDVVETDSYTLIGLGDKYRKRDRVSLLEHFVQDKPVIVLTHNPDTTLNYPATHSVDLTLTGHTHCAQMRVPFLKKLALASVVEGPFDKGLHQTPAGPVFVTCGLGETGLPFRFLNPPTIDVLYL